MGLEKPSEDEYVSEGFIVDVESNAIYEFKVSQILKWTKKWSDRGINELIKKLKAQLDEK